MPPLDLSANARLREIGSLLQTVSGLDDPQAVQREFRARLGSLNAVEKYLSLSRRGLEPGSFKITRAFMGPGDERAHSFDPWSAWDELPVHSSGWLAEVIADDEPKLFTDLRVADDPALGDRFADMRSAMAAPLFDEGVALNWSVMFRREPSAFTEADLEDHLLRGNLIGRMTKNLITQRRVRALNDRLQAQLDEISAIQRSLLPERLPRVPGLDLAASYLTSTQAGGDYYDVFPTAHDRWGLVIADVSGHGAGAATVVAMLNALLHSHHKPADGPAALLSYLNDELAAKDIQSNFVTALALEWDPADRTVRHANAGHHPPSRRRPSGEVVGLAGPADVPLGIVPAVAYEQGRTPLEPADTLVLYTDGVTEAFSPPPEREMFGVHRLNEALAACSGEPACVIDSIHERLYAHTGERTRDDDQTILALRLTND